MQGQPDPVGPRDYPEAVAAVAERGDNSTTGVAAFSGGAAELLQLADEQPGGNVAGAAAPEGGRSAGDDGTVPAHSEHHQVTTTKTHDGEQS